MPLQVLEENRRKDLADSLAEYNRVRKPDMDALRHFDTISSRIWGGESLIHSDKALIHGLHAASPPAAAAPWTAVRCWPSEKSKFGTGWQAGCRQQEVLLGSQLGVSRHCGQRPGVRHAAQADTQSMGCPRHASGYILTVEGHRR